MWTGPNHVLSCSRLTTKEKRFGFPLMVYRSDRYLNFPDCLDDVHRQDVVLAYRRAVAEGLRPSGSFIDASLIEARQASTTKRLGIKF